MKRHASFVLLSVLLASEPAVAADALLSAGGSTITLRHFDDVPAPSRALVKGWVHDAATAVLTVYGRFPVQRVMIDLRVRSGSRIGGGQTFDGRLIRVGLGSDVTAEVLHSDWVMTHEMFHLGFPDVTEGLDWMGEGLSTYLEPLARGRTGNLSEAEVWSGMLDGMPKGLPQAGDRGLDRTPTWGRTYWGGALFWLLADVEIRQRSGNRKSLDDALRAIAAEGGTGSSTWPQMRILRVGDATVGMPVLENLHERLGARPETTDLEALWRQLGVVRRSGSVVFDDAAPLAAIRRAMTRRLKSL